MPSILTRLLSQYRNNVIQPIRVVGIDLGITNSVIAELIWDPSANQEPVANCFTLSQDCLVPGTIDTAFEEKVHYLADQHIEIDLDDGVKRNYAIFADILAKI